MLSRLKLLRKAAGVSQKTLADSIGISQQSINKYENHNIEPDIETLIQIADFFQISVDYLVGHTDIPEVNKKSLCDTSEDEILFLQRYRKLTIKQKQSIVAIVNNYLSLEESKYEI